MPEGDRRAREDGPGVIEHVAALHGVAEAFAETLHVSPIGARDNFFELGGDSLRGAQLAAAVVPLHRLRFSRGADDLIVPRARGSCSCSLSSS